MSNTYTSLHYHIVFSTKERLKIITPKLKNPLFAYLAKTINNEYGFTRKINGMNDHIHICADLKPKFAWQEGYGAFTVSKSSVQDVINYIVTQEEHHKKMIFKDELIKLFKKHEIKYDDKYIWT